MTPADARQLELDLPPEPAPSQAHHAGRLGRRLARRAGAVFLAWLPVVALVAAFAQIALLGLRPVRTEARRLGAQAEIVEERERRLVDDHDLLVRQRAALADPVFQERVARARRSERFDAPPRPLDLPLAEPPAVAR